MIYYLYHIRRNIHDGQLNEGYIGVSRTPFDRYEDHVKRSENPHLQNAISKYRDIEMRLISSGTKEQVLKMENWLRPNRQMGWNIAIGGGMPPDPTGRELSVETRGKIAAKSRLKVGALNPRFGVNITEQHKERIGQMNGRLFGPHFDGVYIVDGIYYQSSTVASNHVGVCKAAVRRRCKKTTSPRGQNGKQSSKNEISAIEYYGSDWIDPFPTWSFIPRDQLIEVNSEL